MPTLPLRAKDVFLQALDVPPTERDTFVAEACGTDARLREEVQSLRYRKAAQAAAPPR
jgi:hypothetical protein